MCDSMSHMNNANANANETPQTAAPLIQSFAFYRTASIKASKLTKNTSTITQANWKTTKNYMWTQYNTDTVQLQSLTSTNDPQVPFKFE